MQRKRSTMPESWVSASLTEVCDTLDHRRIPVNNRERNRRIAGKLAADLYPYYGATGQVGVIDDFIFEGEHILLGEDGAPFLDPLKDKAYLVNGRFWVNNHAHVLKSMISNNYVRYYLNVIDYSDHVTGTTRLKLTKAALRAIPIPIPSMAEQCRIVAKIEVLLSDLDKGIESLNRGRTQLATYRQTVLEQAFQGKLTVPWREANKDKLETPGQLLDRISRARVERNGKQLRDWRIAVNEWDGAAKVGKRPRRPAPLRALSAVAESETDGLPTLPTGWAYHRLGLLIDEPKYGTSNKCDYNYVGTGVLRIPNVVDGVINIDDLKGAHFDDDDVNMFSLVQGDVLMIRSNGSISIVGRSAIVSKAEEEYLYAGYLMRLRSNRDVIIPEYLVLALESHFVRIQIEQKAKSTSGVNNINAREVQSFVVPLCSVDEQRLVIKQLRKGLSTIDALDREVKDQLSAAEVLRQAIMTTAFSGQLVPQEPNDEPASVLLDRIKAEREQIASRAMRRKTGKRKKTKVTL